MKNLLLLISFFGVFTTSTSADDHKIDGDFKNIPSPKIAKRFATLNSYLEYKAIKCYNGIDSANRYYMSIISSQNLNRPYYYTDYLPLTGGILTGALTGTDASFSGNLGIGTTSPTQKLYVDGGARSNSVYIGAASSFSDRSGNGDNIYIREPIQTSGGYWGINIAITGPIGNHTADFYPIRYLTDENNDGLEETERMYISKTGGAFFGDKVGIGTTNPTQKIYVDGGTKTNSLYIGSSSTFSDRGGSDDNIYLREPIRTTGGYWGINMAMSGPVASHTAPFYPFIYSTDENNDGIEDTQRLFFTKTGGGFFNDNVGIGTATPSEKLSVIGNISANGFITAKKVSVTQQGWSDYVFNDDYELRPLKEIARYIKENKHLPEVPSAKEVNENGVDLGANQALLLKKIEELTLYIIQQQKDIDDLRKQNLQILKLLNR